MSWLADVPWSWVQSLHRSIRKTFFTKAKPDAPDITAHASKSELLRAFGGRSYAPNWEFSYNYYGEDLNLARVTYEKENGVSWMQVHVRGWKERDGEAHAGQGERKPRWGLMAHWEPEPTEHPNAHLNGKPFSRQTGREAVKEVLDTAGIEYSE